MKRIIALVTMLLIVALSSVAQNFVAPEKKAKEAFTDTTTTYTYQIQDTKYPVFVSRGGAYYIWKVSTKTGKKYKYYLPKTIQIQMGRKYTELTLLSALKVEKR